MTLGKEFLKKINFFAECLDVLALCKVSVSRMVSVRVTFFYRGSQQHWENMLPSARRKTLSKVFFADIFFCRLGFAEGFSAFAV